jgi:hypothetical protein
MGWVRSSGREVAAVGQSGCRRLVQIAGRKGEIGGERERCGPSAPALHELQRLGTRAIEEKAREVVARGGSLAGGVPTVDRVAFTMPAILIGGSTLGA